MTSQESPNTSSASLRRQLGLATATAAVAGECIGVGIFLTPAGMARSLGSPFWLIFVWLAVSLMTLCGALCYGELAARFPRPGGTYVYLHEVFGPRSAFLYGWMSLLVLDPGLAASLATGLAGYAVFIFPLSPAGAKILGISVVAVLCLINIAGTRAGGSFLRWATWLKFAVLGAIVVLAFTLRLGSFSNLHPFVAQRAGSLPLFAGLAAGLVGAFYSFGGWWDVSKIGGEVRDPERNLPRAMILGVILVAAIYVLITVAFLYVVPIQSVTSDQAFVAQVGQALFGHSGALIFSAIVILCVLGSLAAMIMAAPRVYFAMASDGLFFHSVARPHPRFGTPSRAIAIQGVIASLLIVFASFQQIVAYFIFPAVFFLGLSVLGLAILRRRPGSAAATFCTPGYPLTMIVFLAMVVVLLFMLAAHSSRQAALGAAVVLLGAPLFHFVRRR